MLRIVHQLAEAQSELDRISARFRDEQAIHREATVREILHAVQRHGDGALLQYTAEYDCPNLSIDQLRVTGPELDAAYQQVSPALLQAMELAAEQLRAIHHRYRPHSQVNFEPGAVTLGRQYRPVARVGLYAPRGRMGYPSTVLMNGIPAQVAGVERCLLVTPPNADGSVPPAVLVAAQVAGIQEIYRVGGAQAIGALAYGTATIPRVELIVGPGNSYVNLAKQLVSGVVAVDAMAGAAELMILADDTAEAAPLVADLLAQAERDVLAAGILVTPDRLLAEQVQAQVAERLAQHPRGLLLEKAIAHYGLIVIVDKLEQGIELCNRFGPAQLTLWLDDPWEVAGRCHHAGAMYLGSHTPASSGLLGWGGTLPTGGRAHARSGVGVETFMKQSYVVEYSPPALGQLANAIDALAQAEGLTLVAESLRSRLG
jgi:histidinol dehydrogenase